MHFLIELLKALAGVALAIVPVPPPLKGITFWGGGAGPQGLGNSPGTGYGTNANPTIGNTGPLPPFLPPKSINRTFEVQITATGVPQPLPAIAVQSGAQVGIRAHNGTAAGNQATVYAGTSRDSVAPLGRGNPITPDTEISFPVDNLGQIWICGNAATTDGDNSYPPDGVVVSIRATGFGG